MQADYAGAGIQRIIMAREKAKDPRKDAPKGKALKGKEKDKLALVSEESATVAPPEAPAAPGLSPFPSVAWRAVR